MAWAAGSLEAPYETLTARTTQNDLVKPKSTRALQDLGPGSLHILLATIPTAHDGPAAMFFLKYSECLPPPGLSAQVSLLPGMLLTRQIPMLQISAPCDSIRKPSLTTHPNRMTPNTCKLITLFSSLLVPVCACEHLKLRLWSRGSVHLKEI